MAGHWLKITIKLEVTRIHKSGVVGWGIKLATHGNNYRFGNKENIVL